MLHLWPLRIYTVSELSSEIRRSLQSQFKEVFVEGEISNLRLYHSGHLYFSLKDDFSVIKCVMFNFAERYFGEELKDGIMVLVRGRVDVYEKRGEYQLIIDEIETRGLGILAIRFELLKRKLKEEGIFDEKWKKRIPLLPASVGIITSPKGAAIRDMLKVVDRKFENMHIQIFPVRVQGIGAHIEIIEGIEYFNRTKSVDVIIVARGGGSIEDLAPFNEESLARAIFASQIPVVSGVGHEIDFTICDLVSDLRAPTPLAAADMVIPDKAKLKETILELEERLKRALRNLVEKMRGRIERLTLLLRERRTFFERQRLFLDELEEEMIEMMKNYVAEKRDRLSSLIQRISDLNPESILKRGYSITLKSTTKEVVKSKDQVGLNEELFVLLYDGKITVLVERIGEKEIVF